MSDWTKSALRPSVTSQEKAAIDCTRVDMRIGKKEILRHINFAVQPGEVAGLLGPNGAGKSSLLRIIAGLIPPNAGSVTLFGKTAGVATLADTALLPDRGKLPTWLTARAWLAYAERIYPDWDVDRSEDLIRSLGIKLDARISTLSRGEEARLQLLTCLARRARVVLLDEPFAGVDLVSRERIATSVVRELAGGERAFLVATHDIREMENLFDRIILLADGEVLEVDVVERLRERGSSVEQRYREVFE